MGLLVHSAFAEVTCFGFEFPSKPQELGTSRRDNSRQEPFDRASRSTIKIQSFRNVTQLELLTQNNWGAVSLRSQHPRLIVVSKPESLRGPQSELRSHHSILGKRESTT